MAQNDSLLEHFSSIRKVFDSTISTNEMRKNSLIKLEDLINIKEFGIVFYTEFYFETLSLILEKLTFNTGEEDILPILNNVLKSGPPNQTYLLLYNSVKNCTYEDIKFHKLSSIFGEFLKNGLIGNYLEKVCISSKNKDEQDLSTFVQNVVSTPVVMTNVYQKYAFYQEFYPENFFHIVSDEIRKVINIINTRMSQDKDSSIFSLSMLIGKISLNGYGKIFWKIHMKNISEEVMLNYILRKIYQQILYKIDDYCMNATIEALVMQLSHPQKFEFLFGDLTKHPKITQVLDGLILNRYYSDIIPLKCILVSISSYHPNQSIFINFFTKALESWANKTFIKHRSFEHTYYICQFIMISVSMLKKVGKLKKSATEAIDRCLLTGLPHYLSASLDDLRQVGMVVAVTLASLIPREGDKLQMPYKDIQLTKDLLALAEDSGEFNHHKEEPKNEKDLGENCDKKLATDVEKMKIEVDSDDDDDLIPLQNMEKPRSKKKPNYLGECLEGLRSLEDYELATESLNVCEELIEKNKESKFLHKELCDVLLHLEDRFGVERFEELRMSSMLKLLVVSPEIIAEFLSGEFYAANYNLKQRCDMLHVLVQGAQQLSALEDPAGESNEANGSIEGTKEGGVDWKVVVAERIEKKTRRFCSAKRNVTESKNKLSKFIGWFFYPLMSNFDKSDMTINLLDQDHFVLEKLLMSLSRILYYAHNTFAADKMAKTLLQFILCFYTHSETGVRRSVLACVWACMFVLSGKECSEDITTELNLTYKSLELMKSNENDSNNGELLDNLLTLFNQSKLYLN